MTSTRIVFADGDPLAGELLAGGITSRLEALGSFGFYPAPPADNDEYLARLDGADGIMLGWHLPAKVLSQAESLKAIAFTGIGAANFVDLDIARERGITVMNTPGYANQSVAEHTLALTLAVVKQLATDRSIRAGQWGAKDFSTEFADITIGVIGVGGIGRRFAELTAALGMTVLCWNRTWENRPAAPAGATAVSLEELLQRSNVISLHLGLSEQTTGFLGRDLLSQLRHGAALVNTGRAELVDRDALLEALGDGRIAAAGLDVFHTEPLPTDDPLLAHPSVIATPHIGSFTVGATRQVLEIAAGNLEAYFAGNPTNVVS